MILQKKTGNQLIVKPESGESLKIIPLGGLEEVGRNMTVFEYGSDIVILDMGLQFPEEEMPGIDYVIQKISYLKGKEKNIKGVILSHGHLDHIGAAPILLRELNYPLTIGRDLTLALVKRRMEDFEKNSARKLKTLRINSTRDRLTLGKLKIEFFEVEHSIMDAVGVIIKTPYETIIHPGDWTMEKHPMNRAPLTYNHLAKLPSPRILMLESLGSTDARHSKVTEEEMYENLFGLIRSAEGRVIIGTFASQVSRIGEIIKYSESIGKKVFLDGYSMKMNVGIAKDLGYIKAHRDTLVPIPEVGKFPSDKIVVICTGAQGEDNAVLNRIINDEHRYLKIKKDDTIIFSSSVIPGNERTVQKLKDKLYRKCDNVIHTDILDVHISGHSGVKEIQEILKQVKPDYFLPVYANHYFLKEAAKLAVGAGIKKEKIFVLDNGSQLEFRRGQARLLPQKADTGYVFVDGLGIGDIPDLVIKDRQLMSDDGIMVVVSLIDKKTQKLKQDSDVISRGFVYMKESKELIQEVRRKIRETVEKYAKKSHSHQAVPEVNGNGDNFLKNMLRDEISDFLYYKTQRRPMVIPVIIRV